MTDRTVPSLLIIADDLTGALDTGVQLGKQGIQAEIITHPEDLSAGIRQPPGAEVWIINTESRHISPGQASEKVREAVFYGKKHGIGFFYKKTDSTLRGNLGAELEAFMESTGKDLIPFLPAHPALNRFTRNGFHFIGDIPVHETSFGQDPLEPVRSNHIPGILKEQTMLGIQVVRDLESGGIDLSRIQGKNILVPDCQSVDDLAKIADFITRHGLQFAMAGSAALVSLMPSMLFLASSPPLDQEISGTCLLVNGSLNNISRKQVLYARENGYPVYSIHPELLIDPVITVKSAYHQLCANVQHHFSSGRSVIISSTKLDKHEELDPGTLNPRTKHSFQLIASRIGTLVADLAERMEINSIVVFGGDTLSAIMERMGTLRIVPEKEILPGVALSRMITQDHSYFLISKPGGYGDNKIIVDIFDYLNLQ